MGHITHEFLFLNVITIANIYMKTPVLAVPWLYCGNIFWWNEFWDLLASQAEVSPLSRRVSLQPGLTQPSDSLQTQVKRRDLSLEINRSKVHVPYSTIICNLSLKKIITNNK